MNMTKGNILLGVSGGIAAYKSAELVRLLKKLGYDVIVAMTKSAQEFVTPLTFQALSGNPVHTTLLDPTAEAGMGHIALARWADHILIAPASADLIARLSIGQADDLLTTVCLASRATLTVAPAMNQAMWQHPATQQNVKTLLHRGTRLLGPAEGDQACGDNGPGRMLEPSEIAAKVDGLWSEGKIMEGLRVLVTAGPTREPIDPVRYLSNHSSGKMGYAIAQVFADMGADVTLVSGPTNLPTPSGVNRVSIGSAEEMLLRCQECLADVDILVAAAAVADYRVKTVATEKLKKSQQSGFVLELCQTPDVLATLVQQKPSLFAVGFAAETQNVESYARGKLERKKLDMVIANDVSNSEIGFNSDENAVTVVMQHGVREFEQQAKYSLAQELVRFISEEYKNKNATEHRGDLG